jgi:hypothetical protein
LASYSIKFSWNIAPFVPVGIPNRRRMQLMLRIFLPTWNFASLSTCKC